MSSILEAETLLAVDVGSVNTRANYFDVVEGRYRLIAAGRAPSTGAAPLFDVSEGVRLALDRVGSITGRQLVDESETLIMPSTGDGRGVDIFVATTTSGPKVRAVIVALMPGVSMDSLRALATSAYLDVVEEISLMDHRRDEEQIDLILSARPDLILMAGGTDNGATDSVLHLVDLVSMATRVMPGDRKPHVLFAGNRELGERVMERFGEGVTVTLSSNVRPSLEVEDLVSARRQLAQVVSTLRSSRVTGFDELDHWSGGHLMLTADAYGRMVRYLGEIYGEEKGVLGLDVGASQTTLAVSFSGELNLAVRSDLGMGVALPGLLRHSSLAEITRWLPVEVPDSRVRDYIYNKALNPTTVPTVVEELHLEYVLARQVIRSALSLARPGWPADLNANDSWLLPPIEPVVASGGTLARAPRPGYAALVLLDALEPTGITTLVLDPHNLTPALGVAAGPLPIAAVQALETGSFVSLGTVVAPVGRARLGRRILRVRLEREGEESVGGEVRMGQLVVLPLRHGETGRLTLRPERGIDIGFGGPGRAGALRVAGGAVGLIIDARGRPLPLPKNPGRRRELNQKWLWDIGALE